MNYQQPAYGTPPQQPQPEPGSLTCPKCRGAMRAYNRNGITIEQCETCRGIFLDFGELEALTRMESQFVQQPYPQQPPAYGAPGWGHHGQHHYRKGGLSRLFFSS